MCDGWVPVHCREDTASLLLGLRLLLWRRALHSIAEGTTPDPALAQLLKRLPNPRNPRHFNSIEGGRKRVSTTFMDKNSVSCA